MRRLRWWIGGVLLGLGGYAVFAPSEHEVSLTVGCEPGETRSYRFTYASRGSAKTSVLPGGSMGEPTRIDIALTGSWQETCVEQREKSFVVEVALRDVSGSTSGNVGGLPADGSALTTQAFVEMSRSGRVNEIRYDSGAETLSTHVLRDMLSLRSFALLPNPKLGQRWSTEESDLHGRYRADYELLSVGRDEVELQKRRAGYLPERTGTSTAGASGPRVMPGSEGRFRLHRGGALRALAMKSHVESWMDGERLGSTESSLQLEPSGTPDRPAKPQRDDALAALRRKLADALQSQADDLSGRQADARLEQRMQEQELGSDTWDTLSARLAHADKHESKLFLQLKALFLLSPERTRDAAKLLVAAGHANEVGFQTVAGALAAAGNAEAQRALRDTISQVTQDGRKCETMVGLLGLVNKPTVETESFLLDLSERRWGPEKLDQIARLALGGIAATVATSEPARGERIVSRLLDALADANERGERGIALAALGNTRLEAASPPLLDALSDGDSLIRTTAAQGLRHIQIPEARTALLEQAQRDAAPEVRAAAVTALGEQQLAEPEVGQLAAIARSDASERVRLAALNSVGARGQAVRGVMELLTWAQENDRSAEIRKAAALILTRLRMSG